MNKARFILTINGGSSSVKFAMFDSANLSRVLEGQIERIGSSGTTLKPGNQALPIDASDHAVAATRLIEWLDREIEGGRSAIKAIGHRVVHGGLHLLEHQLVTDELVAELKRNQPLDLAHLPREIALIESFRQQFPGIPQVACFDTAFHRDLPRAAKMFAIPRKYDDAGVRRFGFHGLSYTYLMSELVRLDPTKAKGRVILAHLGSGASMAAVREGKPIDTTMAFTPLAGLVMGTRPGDLDPGLLIYMMRVEKKSLEEMDEFLSHECGLFGVSGTSADMRDLIERRDKGEIPAREAIELFCWQARKWIGALAANLGGLDVLVFAGGIGEKASPIREAVCAGLEFLGVQLDHARNNEGADVISTSDSRAVVRVIKTNEEIVIARAVQRLM